MNIKAVWVWIIFLNMGMVSNVSAQYPLKWSIEESFCEHPLNEDAIFNPARCKDTIYDLSATVIAQLREGDSLVWYVGEYFFVPVTGDIFGEKKPIRKLFKLIIGRISQGIYIDVCEPSVSRPYSRKWICKLLTNSSESYFKFKKQQRVVLTMDYAIKFAFTEFYTIAHNAPKRLDNDRRAFLIRRFPTNKINFVLLVYAEISINY